MAIISKLRLYLGTTLDPASDFATYFVLVLLSTAFGESMSSRLFQHIREDQGLCYSVESFRSHYSDIWGWGIYANAMRELAPRLLEALNRGTAPPGRRAAHRTGSGRCHQPYHRQHGVRQGGYGDPYEALGGGSIRCSGRVLEMEQSARLLRSVTAQEVAELTRRVLHPGHFNLLAYGTRKNERHAPRVVRLVAPAAASGADRRTAGRMGGAPVPPSGRRGAGDAGGDVGCAVRRCRGRGATGGDSPGTQS